MLLIEIQTGLMSAQKIDLELHAFDFDRDLRWGPAQNAGAEFQSFRLANGRVVSFDNSDVAEEIDHCSRDQILSHVHRQRERLQDEIVAVTIDDHARKTVAFAPHHAAQLWIDVSPVPVFGSLRDAAPKKILIKVLPSSRETTRNNLRFRIVNGAPNQMIFAVLERNHLAILGISKNLEHFAGKHPIMSMQNSRTRFDDDACHERGMLAQFSSAKFDTIRFWKLFRSGAAGPP